MPLPAPVDHGDSKTPVAQILHRLEIFFDVLAAAGEDADRSLAVGRWRPARETQFGPIGGLDGAGDDIVGHGIGGNRDERHESRGVRRKALKIKGSLALKSSAAGGLERVRPLPIS